MVSVLRAPAGCWGKWFVFSFNSQTALVVKNPHVPAGRREPAPVPPAAAEGHDPHGDAASDQVPAASAEHRAEHR